MAGRRSSARHETITSNTVTTVELNTQLQPEMETMKTPRHTPATKKLGSLVLASSLLAAALLTNTARAQSGTWINPNGGSWANAANWQGGVIAQGTDRYPQISAPCV